jgi:hypothetical protein
MHYRVTAWVLASTIAPVTLLVITVIAMLIKEGRGVLLVALFWQTLLGFLLLTVSLVMLSPFLLWPLERRPLSGQWKTAFMVLTVVVGTAFAICLVMGPLELSIALGLLLNAVAFVLILPRPNNTVERDEPQAARPSL